MKFILIILGILGFAFIFVSKSSASEVSPNDSTTPPDETDGTGTLPQCCPAPSDSTVCNPIPQNCFPPQTGIACIPIADLVWGSKVSDVFKQKVIDISANLGIQPDWLMSCIAFESGESFSSTTLNKAGSGAVGLIQFMPATAENLGTSTSNLLLMTPEQQLDVVEQYFEPYAGRLGSLQDTYMAILWPAAIGQPDSYVLFDQADLNHPKRYIQNKGLDFNRDGQITKAEASAAVLAKLQKGESYV